MFNTLKYAKMLEGVGFSQEQAETSINILVEIMESKLATRQDIVDLRRDIEDTRQEIARTRQEVARLESSFGNTLASKADLLQLKHDLTLKMGAMLSATVALLTALHKLI